MSIRKLVIALCVASLSSSAALAKPNGYHIRQTLTYQGPVEIKAESGGMHVQTRELGGFFRPEIKGILLVNQTNKKYCIIDPKQWVVSKQKKSLMKDIKKKGTGTYKGLRLQEYTARMEDATHQLLYGVQFWTTNDAALPATAVNDYCKVFGIPDGYGFPIKYVRYYHPNKPEVFLSTIDFQKADIKPAETKPTLTGYQKVADEMDVLMAEAPDEDFNEILKNDNKQRHPVAKRLR